MEMISEVPESEELADRLRSHASREEYRAPEASDWHSVSNSIHVLIGGREEPWIERVLQIWMYQPNFKFNADT